jgi:hypothetical protein
MRSISRRRIAVEVTRKTVVSGRSRLFFSRLESGVVGGAELRT